MKNFNESILIEMDWKRKLISLLNLSGENLLCDFEIDAENTINYQFIALTKEENMLFKNDEMEYFFCPRFDRRYFNKIIIRIYKKVFEYLNSDEDPWGEDTATSSRELILRKVLFVTDERKKEDENEVI